MLIENITLLREKFPGVRKYFMEYEKELQTELVEIKQAKSGLPTAAYLVEGKELMVHSSYDPMREADRIIKSHVEHLQTDTHVMFFGMGMGYHIEAFNKHYPDLTYSIYEPIPEMFLSMANTRQFKEVFSEKLNRLYVDQADHPNLNYLEEFQTENRGIHIIVLPSYENIAEDKKNHFFKCIKDSVQNRRSELHTNTAFQKLWVMNSIKNFNEVLSTANIMRDVDKNQFKDKPAVIVSAGPSLAEDIEYIRYIQENSLAYIFSVGSAINSLLSYDILPDAIFTYDPKCDNHLVFDGVVEKGINSIPMVFGSSVGGKTLERYKGPKAHFITTQDRTSLYFLNGQLDLEHDLIADSPSIAVMTFQILNKLGSNPIIFAGQNLGYLHGRQYSEGIEYQHVNSHVAQETLDEAIRTKDVYGNEIKTNQSFNKMRISIEGYAKFYKNKIFINTTKGGAAIEGVPFKPLEDVIDEFLTRRLEKYNWWMTKNQYKLENIKNKHQVFKMDKSNLLNLLDKLPEVRRLLSKSIKTNNAVKANQALVQFDQIYNKMLDNQFYNNFLSFYLRVFIKYLGNELSRLNCEKDILKKAIRLDELLGNLIEQLRSGMNDLNHYLEVLTYKI